MVDLYDAILLANNCQKIVDRYSTLCPLADHTSYFALGDIKPALACACSHCVELSESSKHHE